MNDKTIVIIGSLIIIIIINLGPIINKIKKSPLKKFNIPKDTIENQVARMKEANEPGYIRPDDNMIAFLHHGVIKYRKRKRK